MVLINIRRVINDLDAANYVIAVLELLFGEGNSIGIDNVCLTAIDIVR